MVDLYMMIDPMETFYNSAVLVVKKKQKEAEGQFFF